MRFHWIDALKGFGIVLVVFAHHSLPVALDTYIFSFHMPLFFFISGFLFDFEKYAESAANFVKGRLRSLIVPYFFFALLTFLLYFLLDTLFQPGVTNIDFFEFSALRSAYYILLVPGSLVSYNPPLWFLPCLFVTELLFYGFAKKCYREPKKLILWLTASGVIGYLAARVIGYLYTAYVPSAYLPFRLPWNADVALSAVVFYGAGNLFRKYTESEAKYGAGIVLEADSIFRTNFFQIKKFFPEVFILLNLLYLGYLLEFPTTDKVNMNVLKYGNFFSTYLFAFSGIFTFVYLFKKIGSSRILEYYGRNSLIVLTLHFFIMDVLSSLIFLTLGIDLDVYYHNAGIALGLTVLNLLLLIPIIFLINNYFPFLLGKKDSSGGFEDFKSCFRKHKSIE